MFGMGWSEMMVVGIVALIVIGPKDLPGLFQQLGQFAGKARGMAREFTNAMNDAARDSGVGDIQKQNDPTAFADLYSLKLNNPNNYTRPRTVRLGVTLDF